MNSAGPTARLVGRHEELHEIRRLITSTRGGISGAVVLRGEAGVGKTALLRAAVDEAPDLQHLTLAGVEAETGFAFAGLQRFAAPLLHRVDGLPAPQRRAIDVAFGRSLGPPADSYLVGLAALNLLAQVANGQPTLVTIDDAHWLDRESLVVLGFVARRLDAEAVAMLFAARHGADLTPLDGLGGIEVGDLGADHALELLQRVVGTTVDARVADKVINATGGNPLALHDLSAALSATQLDGSERLPEPLTVGRRLEDHYTGLVAGVPDATRTWLLLAAAESAGDLAVIESASKLMELPSNAAAPAERAGIVTIRNGVQFRHPLIRSAIYSTAATADRQAAHRALAWSIPKDRDPDRHAMHLAEATAGPDEDVASELDEAASRARGRGGLAARADLLVRAASLTPDRRRAAERLLEAADAALSAGAGRQSQAIVDSVTTETLDPLATARTRLIRANAVALSGEAGMSAQVSVESLAAARLAADHDPEFTQQALAHACLGAMLSDRLMQGTTVAEIADTARAAPPSSDSVASRLVTAFATIPSDGYAAAIPAIRLAVESLLDPSTPDHVVLQHHLLGITLCTVSLDHATTLLIERRVDQIARSFGALGMLDSLLYAWSMTETIWGRLDAADDLLAEGVQLHAVLARSSREFDIYRHPELAAWRGGDRGPIDQLIKETIEAGTWMGHGAVVTVANIGRMILELSCGEYGAAKGIGLGIIEGDAFALHTRVLPDLVEAATRDGDLVVAERALALLRERATAAGTEFGLALLARSTALMAPDAEAASTYLEAIERFRALDARGELGRSHLVYGEWLRRRRRPLEAREQLRIAYRLFSDIGAEAFAERARVELAASGGRARKRSVESAYELTTQERQIASLAANGLTNAEIGSRLFISAQTVDYHLRKVYRKLDVGSRRQLRGRTF